MARHGGHDVLLQLGPLITVVVREDPDNLVRRRADLRGRASVGLADQCALVRLRPVPLVTITAAAPEPLGRVGEGARRGSAASGADRRRARHGARVIVGPEVVVVDVVVQIGVELGAVVVGPRRDGPERVDGRTPFVSVGGTTLAIGGVDGRDRRPVWPKRGKRPSAPPARSNRKAAMARIIDFLNAEIVELQGACLYSDLC